MNGGLQHGCAIAKEQGENVKIAKVDERGVPSDSGVASQSMKELT